MTIQQVNCNFYNNNKVCSRQTKKENSQSEVSFSGRNYRINTNKVNAYKAGLALLAAAGIVTAGIKSCSNSEKDNVVQSVQLEQVDYNGCVTPQDRLTKNVEFCLGKDKPFAVSVIKDSDTQGYFLKITALKNGYSVGKIKENLGIEENVIGSYNSVSYATGRRNWSNDTATIDEGKSIKIPVRELAKVSNFDNKEKIEALRQDVFGFYDIPNKNFDECKEHFEKLTGKFLQSDKNLLKTKLIQDKNGNLFLQITRTKNDVSTPSMYSMKAIKGKLGIISFAIAHNNNSESTTNKNMWDDDAILQPGKSINIPISSIGQSTNTVSKDANESLKSAIFDVTGTLQ